MPYHLEELKLIDLKIQSKCILDLLTQMHQCSYLRKVALVNVNQTDREFGCVVQFVKDAPMLQEIDISWCEVRQSSIARLIETLA